MTKMMRLKKDVKEKRELVNITIDRFLPRKDEYPKMVHKAIRYTLFAGGKRIRPYLAVTVYQLFGKIDKKILPIAAALELIHTYSLIHDDLPDMDNDDYRRGKLASHKIFGEDIALLAGDALIIEAFKILNTVDVKSKTKINLIKEFAEFTGDMGLIAGQAVDIESEEKSVSRKTVDFIHQNKTAKLITAAVRFGAILADTSEEDLRRITEFGETIGLLFQIVDDILDVEGSKQKLGKRPGFDAVHGKATYPKIFGLENAKAKAEELKNKAQTIISFYGSKAEFLKKICTYITTREF
ncbi:MAG: polyprenyl synthetase family protein [Candidatus Cloacimonetes bacterium]|nr:polyprenyl synthetase family protein [Candidatus Cloacimonadota bacterium]MBL7108051.1 polyprenyl synthetase family protein [Candidatus Cloacimonadota bacterium]